MLQMLKTLTSGILEKAKTFKGDWNENDSSSPNYIKNRTHWVEEPKEIEIFNQSFTTELRFTEFSCDFSFEVGKEYIVNFNGVTYTCTATVGEYIGIGNSSALMNGDFSSGEPFYIFIPEENCLIIMVEDYTIPITISISTLVGKVHKIDKKFLPIMSEIGQNGEGKNSEVFNDYTNNIASGEYSHAEGYYAQASGNYSHAEGYFTQASGNYSHAEGSNTFAEGRGSHAEGNFTQAPGNYSHAEGYSTAAPGNYSHAEGYYAQAPGYSSHAEGYYTSAQGQYQHVQGKYNIIDTSNTYAHIVGNGTSSSNKSNAHTVDWSGNGWYQGDVYVGGTSKDTGEKLAKISDINNLITVEDIDAICRAAYIKLIDRTLSGAYVNETVESIGDYAFNSCYSLTSVDFPNVTSIGERVFYYCTKLTTANFPSATSIGDYAFCWCSTLTSINFPNVTSIGSSAFASCKALTSVVFPKVTSIGSIAFDSCTALITADFPNTTSVGQYAFRDCSALTALILRSTTMATLGGTNAFTGTPIASGTGYIYVPTALVASYQSASNWSTFSAQFRAIEDYPDICGGE